MSLYSRLKMIGNSDSLNSNYNLEREIFYRIKNNNMAEIQDKFTASRKSFLELGKLLECETWYDRFEIAF